MTFDGLLDALSAMPMKENRGSKAGYLELVVSKADLEETTKVLEQYFGEAFKPAGARPCAEANELSREYGGIMPNQVMYLKKASTTELGFLWPWGDGQLITLKLIQE